ncbi:MAG TPA: hypothetical protein VM032_05010 [Vicinamibacterales bacterium]|nr:hypothetical protein [Vicinamibacterales bacterium]
MYWRLTYVTDDACLRLSVTNDKDGDEENAIFEIAASVTAPFTPVGAAILRAPIESTFDSFPAVQYEHFVALVRHWLRLLDMGQFGDALGDRATEGKFATVTTEPNHAGVVANGPAIYWSEALADPKQSELLWWVEPETNYITVLCPSCGMQSSTPPDDLNAFYIKHTPVCATQTALLRRVH